jgi:hypothetical protein
MIAVLREVEIPIASDLCNQSLHFLEAVVRYKKSLNLKNLPE